MSTGKSTAQNDWEQFSNFEQRGECCCGPYTGRELMYVNRFFQFKNGLSKNL
jgi:hypothetical protein